jgi:hypothetical protein
MSISDVLDQTCNLYANTRAANGIDTYTLGTTGEACHFERKITEIDTGGGQTELSDGLMVFGPDATVSVGYKVLIGSVSYRMIKCDPCTYRGSIHHYEAFVKQLGE